MEDYAKPTTVGTYVGEPVVDYVRPQQLVQTMIETGASKKDLPPGQIFVRGMYGGALLAYATSISFFAIAQGVPSVIAGLLFPTGFIIINTLGVDLITGYFALVPLAFIHRRMTFGQLLRAWWWVWLGNLAGSVLYDLMIWTSLTLTGATADTTGLSAVIIKIGTLKTTHYEEFGMAGAFAALVKGMLCNWMVTLGVVHVRLPLDVGKAIADVRTDLHVLCDGVRTHGGQPVHHPDCDALRCPDLDVRLLGRKPGPGDNRQFPRWVLVHRRRSRLALLHATG